LTAVQARKVLLDPNRRVSAGNITSLHDLGEPGIYAWFVDQTGASDITAGLEISLRAGLIYAGQAGAGSSSATLASRIRRNHFGGNIYGSTFRLTLASALLVPLRLQPIGGRRMTSNGEVRLSAWMHAHLKVSVVGFQDRLELHAFETSVLELLDPPLNLAKRPRTAIRRRMTELRRAFTSGPTGRIEAKMTAIQPSRPTREGQGLTPEELARDLGLRNAKSVRAFLRRRFPRPPGQLWSRWDPLSAEMEESVRSQFGNRR
jgi:hypothetical protein